MSQAIIQIVVLVLAYSSEVLGGYPPSPSGGYGYPAVKKYPYLPAPPGETPSCAKHGTTYCEKIDTYPTEVISYLLYKWGRTYQQFIKSESDREFALISKTYGPAPYDSYKPQVTGGYNDQPSSSYLPTNDNYQQQKAGNSSNNHEYVASYYRNPDKSNNNRYQREQNSQQQHGQGQGGYGYTFSIPPNHHGQQGSENHLMAAAIPPILHSIWWNHRDVNNNNQQAYPHLNQHNQQSWEQRWSRKKRQALGDNSLCPTVSNYITPQAAMNNEGNWMYVINMDDSQYIQRVRSELCAQGDGSQCNGLCSIPPGYSANCRQKYVQKRLVALDGTGEGLRNDVFWFAHCCVCEVR